ncbi:MAG: squalene synthase HpnC [Nocardioidaceae bacterium]
MLVTTAPTWAGSGATRALRRRERGENFPVAMRLLPRALSEDLHNVYAVARLIDDTGDVPRNDRTRLLHDLSSDLAGVWRHVEPRHPVLGPLARTVRRRDLPEQAFQDLVRANLQDQQVQRYRTFDDLLGYCALSANPVGRIVLAVFGVATAQREAWSDQVCTALQLLEHWQDVAEDRRLGRIYLPLDDLAEFGVQERDLDGPRAVPALRRLMAHEISRAARLLDAGAPLVADLHGWSRVAVSGYVAGGRAAVDALWRTGGDVLGHGTAARKTDTARHLAVLLAGEVRRPAR